MSGIRVWENEGIRDIPVSELTPHPDNANIGDVEAIKQSIRVNGFYAPIIAQASTGYIIVGNHRFRAAQELGAVTVPAIFLDVDDEQAMRLMLADNRTARLGHDDTEALSAALTQLAESEIGLVGTGFSPLDLQRLLVDIDRPLEFPAEPAAPRKREASTWILVAVPDEFGECESFSLRRADLAALSPEDLNDVREALGLGRAPAGAILDMGIPEWR
jgi:ParB-like chromosome segregation protein Spo0J